MTDKSQPNATEAQPSEKSNTPKLEYRLAKIIDFGRGGVKVTTFDKPSNDEVKAGEGIAVFGAVGSGKTATDSTAVEKHKTSSPCEQTTITETQEEQ